MGNFVTTLVNISFSKGTSLLSQLLHYENLTFKILMYFWYNSTIFKGLSLKSDACRTLPPEFQTFHPGYVTDWCWLSSQGNSLPQHSHPVFGIACCLRAYKLDLNISMIDAFAFTINKAISQSKLLAQTLWHDSSPFHTMFSNEYRNWWPHDINRPSRNILGQKNIFTLPLTSTSQS
jgi:hypothetical protein